MSKLKSCTNLYNTNPTLWSSLFSLHIEQVYENTVRKAPEKMTIRLKCKNYSSYKNLFSVFFFQ